MKILIVDDNQVNLRVLRAVLETENYDVVEAWDGVQALEVLACEAVDAIISDILMPRMDGYRLCQEVRRSEHWRDLPFIFYTATYTAASDEKLCYDLGADKYLLKPATRNSLVSALAGAIRGRRRPERSVLPDDGFVMREYNERLVAKLEQKIEELEQARAELEVANRDLDQRVQERTLELNAANQELEAFSSSVSHDLRSPLSHMRRYIDTMVRDCAGQLDPAHYKNLQSVRLSAHRLNELIDALLNLSHVTRAGVERKPVDFSAMAVEIFTELRQASPARAVVFEVTPELKADGDPILLRIVLTNLLGNAWKFTRKRPDARIQFGLIARDDADIFFVRDNGVGFDMASAERLFGAFQRLHGLYDFEGHGIGLATVHRVINRHNGRVWAESGPQKGATFFFTLGERRPERSMMPAHDVLQGALNL